MRSLKALILVCLLLPCTSFAANWKTCKANLKILSSLSEKKDFPKMEKSLARITETLASAKGTHWKRLSIVDFEITKAIYRHEEDANFPLEAAQNVLDLLDTIRSHSLLPIIHDLKSSDIKKASRALASLEMALLDPLTTSQAVDIYLDLLRNNTELQIYVAQSFWTLFANIAVSAEGNTVFDSTYEKMKAAIPHLVSVWIRLLKNDNDFEISGFEENSEDKLAADLKKLNAILDDRTTELSFSEAIQLLEHLMRRHDYPTSPDQMIEYDFGYKVKYLEDEKYEENLVPLEIRTTSLIVVSFSGEMYLAAKDPNISEQTKGDLQIIMTFLLKKLEVLAHQELPTGDEWKAAKVQKEKAIEILESLPFKQIIDGTQFFSRAFDGDATLAEDIAALLERTGGKYSDFRNAKGNLLHEIAAVGGYPDLAKTLEERFAHR